MIVYDRLWKTMKAKKISQYRLIKYYEISSGQISRMRKNMYISTHTVDVLCTILNCSIDDIMEFRMDPKLASECEEGEPLAHNPFKKTKEATKSKTNKK